MHTNTLSWLAIGILALSSLANGCKARPIAPSEVEELAAIRNANNVLVIQAARVLSDPEIPMYRRQLAQIKSGFQEVIGRGKFELVEGYELTKDRLLADLENASRDVGDDGTLIWYISSHGMAGKLRSFDAKTVEASELVDAMRRGRSRDGKVVPMRRLFMFFDYCNADVSAGGVNDALNAPVADERVERDELTGLLDLHNLKQRYPEEAAFASAFDAAVGASRLSLRENSNPIFKEGILFSPSPREQVSSRYGFANAFGQSLSEMGAIKNATLGNLLKSLVKNIAATQQEDNVTKRLTPQRAVFYALPNNAILSEPLYDITEDRYAKPGQKCPQFLNRDWSYNHSRGADGQCYEPDKICLCYDATTPKDTCKLFLTKTWWQSISLGSRTEFAKAKATEDIAAARACYSTCDELVSSNLQDVTTYCGGKVLMINGMQRLEVWNYTPRVNQKE